MPPMGRPRSEGSRDLPPGLYLEGDRDARIKLKGMDKAVRLDGVRDRATALELYWEFRRMWDAELEEERTEALVAKLETAARSGGDVLTVAQYAKQWREERLPELLKKRGGKPLSDKTRADYGRILENKVETWDAFKQLPAAGLDVKHLRQYLRRWITNPNYYNYQTALLSRLCASMVDEGLLDRNPVADVVRQATRRREVLCPMPDYLKITEQLADWQARAADLVYLISHRPGDVLRLEDKPPGIRYEKRRRGNTVRQVVIVTLQPTKNEQGIEIVDDVDAEGGIESVLQWFRDWKKAQGLISSHVVVFPREGFRRRDVGRPVSVGYLSRRLAEAVVAGGFPKGAYQLRDLRRTGLTEEAKRAGKATDKGAHKTEAMKQYYVVGGVPQRHRNTLTVLRTDTDAAKR